MMKKYILTLLLILAAPAWATDLDKPFIERVREAQQSFAPVAFAVQYKDTELLRYLLDQGEDPNQRLASIPIYFSAYEISPHNYPVSIGYRRQEIEQPNLSPLEIAIEYDDIELVKILLEHNPDNAANPEIEKNVYDGEYTHYLDGIVVSKGLFF